MMPTNDPSTSEVPQSTNNNNEEDVVMEEVAEVATPPSSSSFSMVATSTTNSSAVTSTDAHVHGLNPNPTREDTRVESNQEPIFPITTTTTTITQVNKDEDNNDDPSSTSVTLLSTDNHSPNTNGNNHDSELKSTALTTDNNVVTTTTATATSTATADKNLATPMELDTDIKNEDIVKNSESVQPMNTNLMQETHDSSHYNNVNNVNNDDSMNANEGMESNNNTTFTEVTKPSSTVEIAQEAVYNNSISTNVETNELPQNDNAAETSIVQESESSVSDIKNEGGPPQDYLPSTSANANNRESDDGMKTALVLDNTNNGTNAVEDTTEAPKVESVKEEPSSSPITTSSDNAPSSTVGEKGNTPEENKPNDTVSPPDATESSSSSSKVELSDQKETSSNLPNSTTSVSDVSKGQSSTNEQDIPQAPNQTASVSDHTEPLAQPPRPHPHMGEGFRELRVEDALDYLDKVKAAFGDRPTIYNDFLEIMKKFKVMELDTQGVIKCVSDLFRGCNELILGFNTFLPEGFHIKQQDLEAGGYLSGIPAGNFNQQSQANLGGGNLAGQGPSAFSHQFPAQQQGPGNVQMNAPLPGQRPGHHQFNNVGNINMQHPQAGLNIGQSQDALIHQRQAVSNHFQPGQHIDHANTMPQDMDMHQQVNMNQTQQQGGGQQPEFDHAISYVTTIKRRFANQPRTYQQFLEILHTYQKEQRGIREVLEQVSSLFADHPDLLKEFTYFLPEAVQEQAKERLHAAAAEAEQRLFAAKQQQEAANNFGSMQDMISQQVTTKSPPQSRKRPHDAVNIPAQYGSYQMQPEAYVYNAAVERQFFDATKEALISFSRDGELAWAEFLKCMEMYGQDILSKNDMLSIMEDLLGKHHRDLLDEFKRILAAAGAPGAHEQDDRWHSVPLNEIDFSRCRRCTPSYRLLPRDYPSPPFSERSEEEAKVLNDVWISLPDGSEESYTFRHMRKNQHEDQLFRIEDERFEIDMVIDSNACTLKRLEPIAEEIALLQQKELSSRKSSQGVNGNKGAAGKIYKYSFDKRILNTIHKHCIVRIYGDSGAEMLELMYKNPVVAIPIVVKRLRQKDKDFRAARENMNRRWKELAELNYYKSLDHRCLSWRVIDKRATSTRNLLNDIKDRAANNGYESEAALIARREKAKDEHGSFYEVTMGRYLARKMDLTNLPKPSSSIFTPHLSVIYDNNSWAQRDAYRLISFALERGSTSPADKDRCHVVWRYFLSTFFGLSLMWMQGPALAYSSVPHAVAPSIVSNNDESVNGDDESSADDAEMIGDDVVVTEEVIKESEKEGVSDDDDQRHILDQQPIPPGALVLTAFGEGTIIKFRKAELMYEVSFPFGAVGYLNRSSLICSISPARKSSLTKQLMSADETDLERQDDMFIIGPQCLYLFFRLHQILIRRLTIARKLAYSVDSDKTLSTMVEHMTSDGHVSVGQKRYEAYLSLLYGLIESSSTSFSSSVSETGKYEDRVSCLLGHHAYELATMDKLISHILKNLQNMASDDVMQEMTNIFRRQHANGSFKPVAFKQEAALISEGENMFAFQYCKIPTEDKAIMHMEFLGSIVEDDDEEDNQSNVVESSEKNEGPSNKRPKRS